MYKRQIFNSFSPETNPRNSTFERPSSRVYFFNSFSATPVPAIFKCKCGFILKNRIENPEDLKEFSWEGFEFDEALSDERRFVFINGQGG